MAILLLLPSLLFLVVYSISAIGYVHHLLTTATKFDINCLGIYCYLSLKVVGYSLRTLEATQQQLTSNTQLNVTTSALSIIGAPFLARLLLSHLRVPMQWLQCNVHHRLCVVVFTVATAVWVTTGFTALMLTVDLKPSQVNLFYNLRFISCWTGECCS